MHAEELTSKDIGRVISVSEPVASRPDFDLWRITATLAEVVHQGPFGGNRFKVVLGFVLDNPEGPIVRVEVNPGADVKIQEFSTD